MDLWIRSQNKKMLIKSKKIAIEENKDSDECIIVNYTENLEWCNLGIYKTKERALEVLDEIENFLINDNCIVYQMPEK